LLNELHEIGRALADAGIGVTAQHPDLSLATRATLRVQLDEEGRAVEIGPLDVEQAKKLWTIRDGNHNSFPYWQFKKPLFRIDPDDRLEIVRDRRADEGARWTALLSLAEEAEFNASMLEDWPKVGYLQRLRVRREQLGALVDTRAAAVPAAFDRFLRAAEQPGELLQGIARLLVSGIQDGRIATDFPLVAGLLVEGGGAMYFDVTWDFKRLAGDARNVPEITRVLTAEATGEPNGVCSITGERTFLVAEKFPQPNLPVLGQTYLFARNKDAPTNTRYGRTSTDSIAVGTDTASALQAAIEKLTDSGRKDRTWRSIAGERPKQMDLLIAFVQGADDVPLAKLLTEEESEPGAEGTFAAFSEQLIRAFGEGVLARGAAPRPLVLFVFRRVDPGNRKVIYSANLTVQRVLDAARRWSEACGNVPPTLRLSVPIESGKAIRLVHPRDVPPLTLPRLTRQHFIRGGTQRQEIVGIPADEAMRLFLAPQGSARSLAFLILRRVLRSREVLLEGVAEAQARGLEYLKEFDRWQALDTITLLGLLLYRLGRTREEYMEGAAYLLGQLLAGADALHVAYNTSERRGAALPPRLIGNAALPMAQANPRKALSVLGRRWGVYEAWAARKSGQWEFPEHFKERRRGEIDKKELAEYDRSQAILRGLSASRRLRPLAARLEAALNGAEFDVDDKFRSELLLGYIAGPPRPDAKGDHNDTPEHGND
jgi:hypothetical protein